MAKTLNEKLTIIESYIDHFTSINPTDHTSTQLSRELKKIHMQQHKIDLETEKLEIIIDKFIFNHNLF